MSTADRVPRRRRPRSETRLLLLEAGRTLVHDWLAEGKSSSLNAPFGNLKLGDVLDRVNEHLDAAEPGAGTLTSGALYNIWPDQPSYATDLAQHLLRFSIEEALGDIAPLAEMVAGLEPAAAARALAAAEWDSAVGSSEFSLAIGLVPFADVPDVGAALDEFVRNDQRAATELVRIVFALMARTPVAPHTAESIAATYNALLVGFVLQYRVAGDHLDTTTMRDTFAEAVASLLLGSTTER